MWDFKISVPKPPALSPCIGICELGVDEVCVGCLRTCAEITAWGGMDNAQRAQIMREVLPARERERQAVSGK